MKRFVLAITAAAVIFSFGCSKKVEKIDGNYTYKAEFSTKKLYKDVLNINLGDSLFVAGNATLSWKTINEIKGNMITIESSFGDDTSWSNAKGLEVQTSGSYSEEIKEAGLYSYKLTLDNTPMHTFKINVPSISILSPLPTDTTLNGKDISIEFSTVDKAEKYLVFVRGYKGDSIWAMETTDSQIKYEGAPLEYGMVYSVTVSTVILCDSVNSVNVSSVNQFAVKKAE
ncbi:MAG: hypothetical protein PHW02_07390 [bacterium]|nr:hypothetical protein [bacterium]